MTQKGPAKHCSKGITLIDLFGMFPDGDAVEKRLEERRWPNGVRCAHCEGEIVSEAKHPTMKYRCKDCRKYFFVKHGTVIDPPPPRVFKVLDGNVLTWEHLEEFKRTDLGITRLLSLRR